MSCFLCEKFPSFIINTRFDPISPSGQLQVSIILLVTQSCDLTLNQECYIYVSTQMSWTNAEANCVSLGGHLASIHSAAENAALHNIKTSTDGVYIGCHDSTAEGTFIWTDGTAFSYTYWASGEPNNGGNEDYCHFVTNSDRWNDNEGYQQYASICQIGGCLLKFYLFRYNTLLTSVFLS